MSLISSTFCAIVFVAALFPSANLEIIEEHVEPSGTSSPKSLISLYFPVRIDSHPVVLPLKPHISASEQLQTFCDLHNVHSKDCAMQLRDSFSQYVDFTRWCRPNRFTSVPFPAVLQLQNNALLQYEWKSNDWNAATIELCKYMESEQNEKKELVSDCVSVFEKVFLSTAETVRQLEICQQKRRNDILDESIHFTPINIDLGPEEAIEEEADSENNEEDVLDESIQFVQIRYPEESKAFPVKAIEGANKIDDKASKEPTAEIGSDIHFVPILYPEEVYDTRTIEEEISTVLDAEHLDESIVFQPIVFPRDSSLDSTIDFIPIPSHQSYDHESNVSYSTKSRLLNWRIAQRIRSMLSFLPVLAVACVISYFIWGHVKTSRDLSKKASASIQAGSLAKAWNWIKTALSRNEAKTHIGKMPNNPNIEEPVSTHLRQDLFPILQRCASTGIIEQSHMHGMPQHPLQFSVAAYTLSLGRDNPRLPSRRALQSRWISQLSTAPVDISALDTAIRTLPLQKSYSLLRLQRIWKSKRISAGGHRQRSHSFSVMEQQSKASSKVDKSDTTGRTEHSSIIQRQNWSRRQSCLSQLAGQDRSLDGNRLSSAA